MISYYWLIFLGFSGFSLAFYIRHKKSGREKMVCYVGKDCDTVIHSEYSEFFGLPVEVLGMLYYAAIAIAYGVFSFYPEFASIQATFWVLALTTIAFLFSLYLTFIQGFVLKEWCEWCLTSAGICTAIFLFAWRGVPVGFLEFLEHSRQSIVILHALAGAVGVGAATVTDVLFFKFLKDFKISEEESGILKSVSQVIWAALGMLVLTGVGLFLPEQEELLQSAKFLTKMVVVGVIIVNGSLLNLFIAPKLINFSFGEQHSHMPGELRRLRRLAFALGAISLTSWYSAFTLGLLHRLNVEFPILLSLYAGAVIFAVFVSQVADRSLVKEIE